MYGWRGRLGVILPSLNVTTEYEFYRLMPSGVTAHFNRMEFTVAEKEEYDRMLKDVPSSVAKLDHAHVDAMAFACTSGSFYRGMEGEKEIIQTMGRHTGVPCTTTSTAVVSLLRDLNVKSVDLGTPYEEWVNQSEKKYLESQGFHVSGFHGLGLRDYEVNRLTNEDVYRLALQISAGKGEVTFLSCMGLPTVEVLDAIQQDTGKPVFSSNTATLWMLLKMIGIYWELPGLRGVMENHEDTSGKRLTKYVG